MKLTIMFLVLLLSGIYAGRAQEVNKKLIQKGYNVESFSEKDLMKWEVSGKGQMAANHGQLVFSEVEESAGYMIVSSKSYNENVIMTFDVLTLNPATVLIVEMCASNKENGQIEFPGEYNGNVQYLFGNMDMYMFAFHNAAHNKTGPFIRKFRKAGMTPLAAARKNALSAGVYHHVELGKTGEYLWLKVDGKKVVDATDPDYLKSGKLIFRIRGTAWELASCIIKNMKIYSK